MSSSTGKLRKGPSRAAKALVAKDGAAGEPASSTAPVKEQGGLTAYAKRLPKPFGTDDAAQDAQLLAAWRVGQKVVSAMEADMTLAVMLWNHLETVREKEARKQQVGWDESTVNLARLPKYFLAQVLVAADPTVGQGAFSQQVLDEMSRAQRTQLDEMSRAQRTQ